MKHLLTFVLILFVFSLLHAGNFNSTTTGGLWSLGTTWIGGLVPGGADNVTINGPVAVNVDATCHDLTIAPSGVVYNHPSSNFTIYVTGTLSNNGSLGTNPAGGLLYLASYGNLANNGNLSPYIISLAGSVDQYLSGSSSISAVWIYDELPASRLILASNIGFTGVNINLGGSTIVMGNAAQDYSLTISGGYLYSAQVDGDAGDRIILQNDAYLSWVTCDEIELWGDNIMLAECQFGILRNHGNLRNFYQSNYGFTVTTKLENYGTIEDHGAGGLLYLYLAGDLYNHGTISNYYIYFQNTVTRNIWQGPSAQPIACDLIYSDAIYAGLQALSDLSFSGCQIFLYNMSLSLEHEGTAFGITLQGGFLNGAVLDCASTSYLNMSGNAYITNTSIDEMIWQGTVCVADYVSIGRLVNMGTLYNYQNSNYSIAVGTYLENRGTIADNPAGGLLHLYLGGDLYDHGSISNYHLVFNNSIIGSLLQSPAASPISCDYFTADVNSAGHRLLSNLSFSACNIDFGSHSLDLAYQQSGYSIAVQGGYLVNATLHGGSTATLNLGGNAYLSNVSADEISFQGTVLVANGVSIGVLRNLGTLHNYYNSNYMFTVQTRLENQGSITSYPSSGLLLIDLFGDLWDYGILEIYSLNLNKPSTMELFQADTASPIQCSSINRLQSSGDIQLLSDLRCQNTVIQMYSNRILMHNGRASYGLQLAGGALSTTILVTNGYSSLELFNNAYLYLVTGGDMILSGDVLLANDCSFVSIVNYGSLRNYWTSNFTATCSGDLVNYGTISNHTNGGLLILYCAGNISNFGSIQNYNIYLQSTSDQFVLNRGSIPIGTIIIMSDIGDAYWFFNGNALEPPYYSGQIGIDANQAGVWYPQLGANRGRYVTVGTGSSSLASPTGLSLFWVGSELKLSWNEVAGAIYYNVWYATAPAGTFTLLAKVFDHQIGDGTVRSDLDTQQKLRFYRVTAGN